MIEAILYVFAALMNFFVLTEIITVKLHFGENHTVELGFIIFAIVFKKTKSYRRIRAARSSRLTKLRATRYAFILTLLKRCDVEVRSLRIFIPDSTPSKNALRFGLYNGLVYSFLAFLENNSSFFTASNITLSYSEHNKLKKQLEAEFKISLLDVFISAILFTLQACGRLLYQKVIRND